MAHDPDPATGLSGRDLIGLGGLLVGAVVVGTVAGLVIDHAAGTDPVFTIIGVFVGILAGGLGFFVRVRSALHS